MNNIGKKIRDFYCNGAFGRRYDLSGAEVIDESNYSLTIKLESEDNETEEIITACFDSIEEKDIINNWF